MNSITSEVTDADKFDCYIQVMNQFSETLKTWRKARRLSQLDLALEAEVSARHISFLETGRAKPSREMVGRISDALHLPLATRNQMLTHAGFAAKYADTSWNADEMAAIRTAIDHTLTSHNPYPAFAVDRLWNVVEINKTADRLFGNLGVTRGASLLELALSPALPQLIENWPEVAYYLVQRLRTESAAQGGVLELDEVAGLLGGIARAGDNQYGPIVPTIYRLGEIRLSLFSTISQFGTAVDLALDDLKVELFFPADEATASALYQLARDD